MSEILLIAFQYLVSTPFRQGQFRVLLAAQTDRFSVDGINILLIDQEAVMGPYKAVGSPFLFLM